MDPAGGKIVEEAVRHKNEIGVVMLPLREGVDEGRYGKIGHGWGRCWRNGS